MASTVEIRNHWRALFRGVTKTHIKDLSLAEIRIDCIGDKNGSKDLRERLL